MDDIVFSATVNTWKWVQIITFKWLYYYLSTEECNVVVLSLSYYDVSTEQDT